ncbi:hypothetical protein ACHAWF_018989 [Thalassiosira exigua]
MPGEPFADTTNGADADDGGLAPDETNEDQQCPPEDHATKIADNEPASSTPIADGGKDAVIAGDATDDKELAGGKTNRDQQCSPGEHGGNAAGENVTNVDIVEDMASPEQHAMGSTDDGAVGENSMHAENGENGEKNEIASVEHATGNVGKMPCEKTNACRPEEHAARKAANADREDSPAVGENVGSVENNEKKTNQVQQSAPQEPATDTVDDVATNDNEKVETDEIAGGKTDKEQRSPHDEQPATTDATSSDSHLNGSLQMVGNSQDNTGPGSQEGESGQSKENDDYYKKQSGCQGSVTAEVADRDSQESSSAPGQNENCTDDPTEEGSLFEDSNGYGDEIGVWMQQRLEQQRSANGQQPPQKGDVDSSSITSADRKPRSNTSKQQNSKNESGPSKRTAEEMLDCSSSQKSSTKRRRRPQLFIPGIPGNYLAVDRRSPSRKRMDETLNERDQSQMALREALLALERAKKVVSVCRSRYDAARTRVQATAKAECESLLQEDTPWNDMFQKLKHYKDKNGDCNVRQNFAGDDGKGSPDLLRRLSVWVAKNRKEGKLRGRGGVSTVDTIEESKHTQESKAKEHPKGDGPETADWHRHQTVDVVNPDEDGNDLPNFEHMDPDSILADPYKEIALDSIGFDWDPRNSRWNSVFEELRFYKAEHGNALVPHSNGGLGAWVKRQQVQYGLWKQGKKSDLNDDRVRLLNSLGFVWSRRANAWEENFLRLAKWKETNGTLHIPDETQDPELAALNKWVSDQRVHYKRQTADKDEDCNDDPSGKKDFDDKASPSEDINATKKKVKRKPPKLSDDQISKLESIGFEFDSRDARWLQKFDVLLKYKKSHGDFLVPSNYPEDHTLSNWVKCQRTQYRLFMKGSKSHMTERRVKILTDAGFPFSVNEVRQKVKIEAAEQDRVLFDAKSWLEKFKVRYRLLLLTFSYQPHQQSKIMLSHQGSPFLYCCPR